MTAEELSEFFAGLARWTDARRVPVETLRYGPHEDQFVEIRRPRDLNRGALALVLHGGFWRAGYTCRNSAGVAVALTDAGWTTANVEYRRLGAGAYEPLLDDVAAARDSLDGHHPVVAIGHSAGGHLALWLAAQGAVDAAITLGGICDLGDAARAGLGDDAVQDFLGGGPSEVPDAYATADPAQRLPLGAPQILVHGVDDDRVPLGHAREYAARAQAAGDPCQLVEVQAGHFEVIDPRSPVWPDVLDAVGRAGATAQGVAG